VGCAVVQWAFLISVDVSAAGVFIFSVDVFTVGVSSDYGRSHS
jgi:hypothetical protein